MRHRALCRHVAAVLLVGALGFNLHLLSREMQLTFDEPAWITAGHTTVQLYRRAAPASTWDVAYDSLQLGDWGNRNPPVGKVIIGLAAERGLRDGDRVAYRWTWGGDPQLMAQRGELPPSRVLMAARDGIVVCATLCLLLAYIIALQLVDVPWLTLLAPLGVYAIPVFRLHAVVVYTDIPQLMFLLLASSLYLLFLRRRRAVWLLASAVAAGLACATKLSAAPIVAAAALSLAVLPARPYLRVLAAGAFALTAVATFVAVNPYLHPAPLARTAQLIEQWREQKSSQQNQARKQPSRISHEIVESRLDAVSLVLSRAVFSQELIPNFDQRQPGFLGSTEAWSWMLLAAVLLYRWSDGWRTERRRAQWLLLGLALGCISYLAVYQRFGGASSFLTGLGLLYSLQGDTRSRWTAVVFVIFAVFIACWLPFDWARYYLPIVIWVPLLQLEGLLALWRRAAPELRGS